MATQKDLDKLRKQLSDLDAKLKSMRGNQKAPVARPPNFVDMGRDVPRRPIDMVRDPRFDSAMAQKNYANLMAFEQARLAAQQGQYTQGRLMGAPTEQQLEFGDIARQRPLQSEIDKKYIDDGRGGRILNPIDAAKVKSQFDQIQANIAADPNPARYFPIVKIQMPGSDALNQDLANRGMGGGIPAPIPQNPQMQTYNNLLQQGIQRSNTMNQDAASNFANMQAGAPIPQPAAPAKANPTMPIAGMGMQQPKATPVPRKFSTVNTPSARFG